MRHIHIGLSWIQENSESEELAYKRVWGTENIADLMTKHLAITQILKFVDMMSLNFESGRASSASRV